MPILFILSLVLAWPTFGLSFLLFLIFAYFDAQRKTGKAGQRNDVFQALEVVLAGRFSEFYRALDLPFTGEARNTVGFFDSAEFQKASHQCGRLIVQFLANNPGELEIFKRGLRRWRLQDPNRKGEYCDPVLAARFEAKNEPAEIHYTALRAIESLISQNNLPCFGHVVLAHVTEDIDDIEKRGFMKTPIR